MKKIKEYLLKDRTPFAEGLSFKKMFLIFVIFSFLGCLYEDILFMAKNYLQYMAGEHVSWYIFLLESRGKNQIIS